MIQDISSAQNPKYKYIKSLKTKKSREKLHRYTVEGIKSVKDAISANAEIELIAVSDNFDIDFDFANILRFPQNTFLQLCNTETPQGIIAVIKMPEINQDISSDNLYLYCDRITDPGNMGTIIRICDAVDCTLLLSEGCVDIYNPKTVRASMGSFFHTRTFENVTYERVYKLKNDGYTLVSGALGENTTDYSLADYGNKTIIVIGNEANGVSTELLSNSDFCAKIPIWGRAESLNAAVAASLMLYEVKKKHTSATARPPKK